MELTIGMKGTVSTLAERQDTALEVGSVSYTHLTLPTICSV